MLLWEGLAMYVLWVFAIVAFVGAVLHKHNSRVRPAVVPFALGFLGTYCITFALLGVVELSAKISARGMGDGIVSFVVSMTIVLSYTYLASRVDRWLAARFPKSRVQDNGHQDSPAAFAGKAGKHFESERQRRVAKQEL
jgi:hypothetical protein